ncbi:glutamyl-tRNA reductase [Hippea maritima]|uniref:Glutamyl-tRNA reductase n=1 Tax=Hippea maritima (strain ATCC 700847 / DSM 10411 / MH2) TaxID=760142 RepID=F2LWE5_HIPMA|nr:glutamyl-tRNA reductase [Hippea maritima]AEA32991.1 Glutamyl-tRNA reductase [Hippea maritima DSM 10411]
MNNIVLIGTNHNSSPQHIRERLAFDNNKLDRYLKELRSIDGVSEVMIISTCNRVEVLYVSSFNVKDRIVDYLSEYSGIDKEELKGYLYVKENLDAVRHIFRVASSLDSMVVGEPQILGQIKDAYRWSVEFLTSGATINRIMRRAFHAAKVVKANTDISKGAVSVAYAGFLSVNKLVNLEGKKVLSIGSGEMNRLALEYFSKHGAKIYALINRTKENVKDLCEKYNVAVYDFCKIKELLNEVDIVITATSAKNPIIKKDDIPNRNLIILDLALPRDTQKGVENLENVVVIFVDDLKGVVDETLKERKKQAQIAEKIIEDELRAYQEYVESLDYDEVIKQIRLTAERIRKLEMYRFQKMYKNKLNDDIIDGVDKLTKSLLSKVLHEPTMNIKQFLNHPEGDLYIELLRRLFGLSKSKRDVRCFFSENN